MLKYLLFLSAMVGMFIAVIGAITAHPIGFFGYAIYVVSFAAAVTDAAHGKERKQSDDR